MYRALLSALAVCLAVTACGGKATPDPNDVARAVAATLTAVPPSATQSPPDTPISTSTPIASPSPLPANTPIRTAAPTPTARPTATPTATPRGIRTALVKKNANLRQGPGTDYAIVGSAASGDVLELVGRNEAGDWLYVEAASGQAWMAAFLMEHGDIRDLPVESEPAVAVPAGWKQYHPEEEGTLGQLTFMYPPRWTIPDWMIAWGDNAFFDLSTGAYVNVFIARDIDKDQPSLKPVGTDDPAALNELAAMLARVYSTDGVFVLQNKSIWRNRGYRVEFTVETEHHLDTSIPLGDGYSLNLSYSGRDNTMTQEERSAIDLLLSTLQVELPTDSEPSEPLQTEKTNAGTYGAIRLLDWTWYESSSGNYIHVDGEIQNTSSHTIRYVQVHVKLLNSNGRLLGVDSSYSEPSDLRPGDKALFSIMARKHPGLSRVQVSQVTWRE